MYWAHRRFIGPNRHQPMNGEVAWGAGISVGLAQVGFFQHPVPEPVILRTVILSAAKNLSWSPVAVCHAERSEESPCHERFFAALSMTRRGTRRCKTSLCKSP